MSCVVFYSQQEFFWQLSEFSKLFWCPHMNLERIIRFIFAESSIFDVWRLCTGGHIKHNLLFFLTLFCQISTKILGRFSVKHQWRIVVLANYYLLACNFRKTAFCCKYFSQISRTTSLPGNFKGLLLMNIKMFLFAETVHSKNYLCVKIVRIQSFSGSHFPAFGVNTEFYSVNLRIQSECRKMRTKKNSKYG